MDFITKFLKQTEEGESPTSFFKWAAVSMLSATMRNNVYLKWQGRTIYPNLYIMLLADSGACRKGYPVSLTTKFLTQINNTKLIVGRSSIQGVLQELANTESSPNKLYQKRDACGIQLAEEYAASFVHDPALIGILTDIYDFRELYQVRLRDSTTDLKNVCFSFFVATNSILLQQFYDLGAIEGGLVGRIFIIHEKKRRKKNALVRRPTIEPIDYTPELLTHLHALAKIKGEAIYEDAAVDAYEDWYNRFDDDDETVQSDKTGFIWRVHTGVAKISLALAAAEPEIIETKKILVKEKHVLHAIELAFSVKHNQQQLTMGRGVSATAQQMTIFLLALGEAPNYQLTRRNLLAKNWQHFDNTVIDNIINTFSEAGLLKTTAILNETGYQLTPVAIEKFLAHKNDRLKDKDSLRDTHEQTG